MSFFRLIQRGIFFYWPTSFGIFAVAVFGSAVLTGALLVGDSVRGTLRQMVDVRLGGAQLALVSNDRFFRADLAGRLSKELGVPVAAVLQLNGLIVNPANGKRVNRVNIYGVDDRFHGLGRVAEGVVYDKVRLYGPDDNAVVLNRPLAERLQATEQTEVVLRIAKPGVIPRDVPVVGDNEASIGIRLTVQAIADEADFGGFSLKANQTTPMNVFVPIGFLAETLDLGGIENRAGANMLLVAGDVSVERAEEALAKVIGLEDVGLEVREIAEQRVVEVRSRRVFIDDYIGNYLAGRIGANVESILTYFVNELNHGDRSTPYSMVAALMTTSGMYEDVIPDDMTEKDIVINQWLADDLDAGVGSAITLKYYVVGPDRGLLERSGQFQVRKIVPMKGHAADPTMMPNFPGLSEVDDCRRWKPGIDIDLDKLRDKDQRYWDDYRGTPKAFVNSEAANRMWKNRFGNVTSLRYPTKYNTVASVAERLRGLIEPDKLGFVFLPVRQSGQKASAGASDFGGLFAGMSMFLIGSAVVLLGLVFVFGVERRTSQAGMLMAVGYTRAQVGRLLFGEGLTIAAAGSIVGAVCAIGYTRLMIWGLETAWAGAVADSAIRFHARPGTVVIGAGASFMIALLSIWFALRRGLGRQVQSLLTGNPRGNHVGTGKTSCKGLFMALPCLAAAAVLMVISLGARDSASVAGLFFAVGALLLVGGLGLTAFMLAGQRRSGGLSIRSVAELGRQNTRTRPGRSLAVVAMLACGVFMVIAVGANRKDPTANAESRDSGTGGFALYGESAIGVVHDLDTKKGRDEFGLADEDMAGVNIIGMRVRDGDDASCLNLNRPQQPRLLGVDYKKLSELKAFSFQAAGWEYLNVPAGDTTVPAIGDYATVHWALGKGLGDEIDYVDERGKNFKVRIVGILKNSIMQGSLLISEETFIERFPSVSGHRAFLIDAPDGRSERPADELTRALRDYGLDIVPAWRRLADFAAVENTYLSIFQLLGGLGMAIGSIGLGLVVLLNVLERRGELAMLRAVGFDKQTITRMVLHEHRLLLVWGLVVGVVSAVIAVTPAILNAGSQVPLAWLGAILSAILFGGLLWIWLAVRVAMASTLLDALRTE